MAATLSDEQVWVNSLKGVNVRDVKEKDETERRISFILLRVPSKRSGLRKKPSQWALMAQFSDDGQNVRYIFSANNDNGQIVAVRSDYLPAGKWTCKFLGTVDMSLKALIDRVRNNPLNGCAYKQLNKKPRKWTEQLCQLIDAQFLQANFWNKKTFVNVADVGKRQTRDKINKSKRNKKN